MLGGLRDQYAAQLTHELDGRSARKLCVSRYADASELLAPEDPSPLRTMTKPREMTRQERAACPRVRTPQVNVTLGILLGVAACRGTTQTQPSSYTPRAAAGSPHITPQSIVTTPQETASASGPDQTFAARRVSL